MTQCQTKKGASRAGGHKNKPIAKAMGLFWEIEIDPWFSVGGYTFPWR
jgi:hypothetical protein